jgi:hypothetical protein
MPIRDRKNHYIQVGTEMVLDRVDPAISIEFKLAGNVPPYAREAVMKLANWGVGVGENEDPFTRCGAVDTEVEADLQGWDDATHAFVCERLRAAGSNGIEYVIVEAPKALKPFPKYDDIVGEQKAEQIAFYVEQLGIDPGSVKQYELENDKDGATIDAMDALIEKQNEDVVEVISAPSRSASRRFFGRRRERAGRTLRGLAPRMARGVGAPAVPSRSRSTTRTRPPRATGASTFRPSTCRGKVLPAHELSVRHYVKTDR